MSIKIGKNLKGHFAFRAIKICDEGDKFARELCEDMEEFYEQGRAFRTVKTDLYFILSKGRIYYYKKREQYKENYSKWCKATRKAWKEKGNLPVFDLKKGRMI
ncbi:hypothetical protein ES708_33686 [subsurface metagenome]